MLVQTPWRHLLQRWMAATMYFEIQCLVVKGVLDEEVEMAVKN